MSSRSYKPAWQDTWLWKALAERAQDEDNAHASEFLPVMELWMRKLDTVLAKGGTAPADFTLHDADHALRVAHRMEDLLSDPIRQNLSDYEIALLLLAAYGHDIGMTPERGKVIAHHRHLFHPEQSALTAEEKDAFQTYLDENVGQTVTLPLSASLADLNLADELVTFYVRERHNDWSAEWLRHYLDGEGFGFLPDAVEILVRLCTSHHLDVHRLEAREFDPFLSTGSAPQLIHLRYLACLLRLADILENDPERTPAVLLRHRGLAERKRSLFHWQKDHALTIDIRGDRLHFQARPRTAVAHRALLDLKEWIDHELHGIASFGERLPAEKTVGNSTIRRDWHLAPAVTHDIRPADESYEYIDGAFRPDTARLLQLLSGEQLYGNRLHAVRELLQNAFDAVREKIARRRLDLPDPADCKWEETLGNQEHVTLTLRPAPDGGWQLVCEDSGVGLTRDIINRQVLVSGTGRRHAIRQLERDCKAKGFRPGLTGQFGIGVLSYFMLADEVTLETTRYQGCGEGVESWHFTTRGVGSFGELKKLPNTFPAGGTRVIWGLKRDEIEDPDNPGYIGTLGLDLLYYLIETLVRIPCRFTFRREETPGHSIEWSRPAGWVRSKADWLNLMRLRIEEESNSVVHFGSAGPYWSEEQLAELEREELEKERKLKELQEVADLMRCEFKEVQLPNGMGFARLVLGYFELSKGNSLKLNPGNVSLGQHQFFHGTMAAWKGMKSRLNPGSEGEDAELHSFAYSIEVDLMSVDPSAITVSREGVLLDWNLIASWKSGLKVAAEPWIDQILEAGGDDYFHDVNLSFQRRPLSLREGCGWFHLDGGEPFRSICRPVVLPLPNWQNSYGKDRFASFIVDSKQQPVASVKGGGNEADLSLGFEVRALQRRRLCRQMPCLFWPINDISANSVATRFPREWADVGFVRTTVRSGATLFTHPREPVLILNGDNILIRLLSENKRIEVSRAPYSWGEVWSQLDQATDATEAVIALCGLALEFLRFDDMRVPEGWETYREKQAGHLMELWKMISAATGRSLDDLSFVASTWNRDVLVRPSGVVASDESDVIPPLLPCVTDPGFLLYEVEDPA